MKTSAKNFGLEVGP